jgi:O-antigen/teichoic acid export membrane protein
LLAAGVTAWALGGRLRGLVLAQVVAGILTALVGFLAVRRVFRPAEVRDVLRAPPLRGFSRFSLTLSAAELLNVAYQRVDLLIVTAFLGAKGAAVYAAAEFVTRVIANIRYAFDAIVAGVMAESLQLGDRPRLRYNLQLATRWVVSVAALVAGVVVVLRREILGGLYGSTYVAGAGAVLVLAVSHLVSAALGLVGWVLVAGGRSRLALINNFIGLAVNIGLSLWLTPRYGLIGTAIAVLATILVVQGAMLFEMAALEGVWPFSVALWKPLVAAAAALGVESIAHAVVVPAAPRVVAVIAAGLVVYLTALFSLGLPPEEDRWARRLIGRVGAALRRARPAG